jgi:hypothetical protein
MLPAMVRLAIGLVTGAALLQPAVMVEHEPMHRVVFENRLVRVIDAAVAPGQATAYHTHERDNVPVAVAPGTIAATERGGRPVESAVPLGAVSYAVGGYTHEVSGSSTSSLSGHAASTPPPVARAVTMRPKSTTIASSCIAWCFRPAPASTSTATTGRCWK